MKKYVSIILVTVALVVASCDDFLDQQPVSQLSEDIIWKIPSDAAAGVAGMYDGIQAVVSSRYIDWGEGRSDNLTNGGTGVNEINFALNGLTANMDHVSWDALYRVILRANLVIAKVPGVKDLTVAARDNYLAQAYAARAFSHLLAVKVWGDVPLTLEATKDLTLKPFRIPADEVLAQVVEDLVYANSLVDAANTNVYELNKGAILAILMDAYMWQKDYTNALATADKIIALNRYALATSPADWNKIFSSPTSVKEPIWSIFWDFAADGSNGISGKIGSSTNTSPFVMDPAFQAQWQTMKKDFRRYLTYDTVEALAGNVQDIYKHYPLINNDQQLPPTSETTVPNIMYRLADILLMRAEALNRLDRMPEAVTQLNVIKTRAGLTGVSVNDFADKDALEIAILNERRFELFAEGKRWFDLRRTGRVIEVMDPVLRQRQAARNLTVNGWVHPGLVYFPIHRNALNENPNLQQTDPYSR